MKLLRGAVVALAVTAAARDARGAPCCGESHGFGERLASSERAAATVSFRLRERYGAWSATGGYALLRAGSVDRELRADAGWLVRLSPSVQLGATVPVLGTWKHLGGAEGFGGGLGDVMVSGRYDLHPPTRGGPWPGVALTLGVSLPTGRGPGRARDPLAADVTGSGVAELRPGITLEKSSSAAFVMLLGTVALRGRGPTGVDLGPRWQAALLGGPRLGALSLGLGLLYDAEPGPAFAGSVAPASARRRTAALAFCAYDLSSRWTLLASAQNELPLTHLGQNDSTAIAGSLGVRHVWGPRD